MELKILKWSYSGIRGVGDLEISLVKKSGVPYHTTLFMMPNGTGKTTTISLLRAALDGQADKWTSDWVMQFQPEDAVGVSKGKFIVSLQFDEQLYVVYLTLDYIEGKAYYETSKVDINGGGLTPGHRLPREIKPVFTDEFVKRFVFDGELAKDIIDSQSGEAEAAIRYLYQLNRLDEMQSRIDAIVREIQKKNEKTNASTDQGVTWLRTGRDKIAKTLQNLISDRDFFEGEIKLKKKQLEEVIEKTDKRMKSDENIRKQVEELEKEMYLNKAAISELIHKIMSDLRSPNVLGQRIAGRLAALSTKMRELQLPKTTSKQFFEELSKQDTCVCGRTITSDEQGIILQQADKYLAEDQYGVINAIKQAIKNKPYKDFLDLELKGLSQEVGKREELARHWDRLHSQRINSGDIELEKLENQKKELESDIEELSTKYSRLTTNESYAQTHLNSTENIPLCEKELYAANERLAEASNTVRLVKQAEKAKSYLEKIRNEALVNLKRNIIISTNEKISKIIRNERIKITGIDGHLRMGSKKGASVGQTLAIAYSFLGSMFESSAYKLPFIVDSPAGALDLAVRRQVAQALPQLFEQLIVFITSGEREGFSERFYEDQENTQFLTIYREQDHYGAQCSEGIQFYKNFHDDEEEENQ